LLSSLFLAQQNHREKDDQLSNTINQLNKEKKKLQKTVEKQRNVIKSLELQYQQLLYEHTESQRQYAQKISHLEDTNRNLEGFSLENLSLQQLKELSIHQVEIGRRISDHVLSRVTSMECVVCMDGTVDTVCVPCGHFILCGQCAKKIEGKCPTCRFVRF
jgi:hypothetical protein